MKNTIPWHDLVANTSGKIILPTDATYDNARSVFNGMIDRRPEAIAYCQNSNDVVACVRFARNHKLIVSVRAGGHNAGGLGVIDGGLVIDVSMMKDIRIDPSNKTAVVQCGCTLGEIDKATHQHGLALPSGVNSTTGIAGLTLGGGLGYLTRRFGLTIDNLVQAEVVLANGSIVQASLHENEDLFWGLRGGGGNFGIVTNFVFKLHPVSMVYGGPMLWNLDDAKEVMQWYRQFITTAPEDVYGFFAFLTVPPAPVFPEHLHFKKMCAIVWCYTGESKQVQSVFNPIRQFKPPALDLTGDIPFPALQGMFDASAPRGMQMYWKADFVNELPDEAIDLHIKHASRMPTLLSMMHLYPVNGAAAKFSSGETAWSFRKATWSSVIVGSDPDPSNKDLIVQWAKDYWQALHPFSAGGGYVNFLMEENDDVVRSAYGDNLERLQRVKKQYDPDNFFQINQNILPHGS